MKRLIPLATMLLLPLAACGSTGDATDATPPTTTSATAAADRPGTADAPAPTTKPPATTRTTAPTGGSLSGTQYAFVRSADLADRRITFDLVEYYEGKAAVRECREDGEEPAENDWCTGWYIRNNNKRLRTLTVYPDAPLTLAQGGTVDLKTFVAAVRDGRLISFDVDANRIMSAREIYTP